MLDIKRTEKKYLISTLTASNLSKKLKVIMKEDPNNGIDGYMVRSLYFDTLYDRDFEDKVDGLDGRQKIRLRIYSPKDEYCKLELKEKQGNVQRKRTISLSRLEAYLLTEGDFSFLLKRNEPLAAWLYTFMTENCYRPKCIVEYKRKAYIQAGNNTRVTIDRDLRSTELSYNLFSENLITYPVTNPGEGTLEVKYDNFLITTIKEVISGYNLFQLSNSKYCRARMISKRGRY